jgi:hypothetical protein
VSLKRADVLVKIKLLKNGADVAGTTVATFAAPIVIRRFCSAKSREKVDPDKILE